MDIKLRGVETNNLKSIDITIADRSITAICGVSGGGKSSLAYDTLYNLCNDEFTALETGTVSVGTYKISSASGLRPAVALGQINTNVNPRSTIYSNLNFASLLTSLQLSLGKDIELERFKLNKPTNSCSRCGGLGAVARISLQLVVDYSLPISSNPFRPWQSRDSNKQYKLLMAFASDRGIRLDRPLSELSVEELDALLYGKSEKAFQISFNYKKKRRTRKLEYRGVIADLELRAQSGKQSDLNYVDRFSIFEECPACFGSRVDQKKYNHVRIAGIPFVKLIRDSITDNLARIDAQSSEKGIDFEQFASIRLLRAIDSVGLGYLSLSRSIPSLSGGELQKLRFAKLTVSEISGILVVVDEISAHLHRSDFDVVLKGLRKVSDAGNTVLLVEHNRYFIDQSDHAYELGPGAGEAGGELIALSDHIRPLASSSYSPPDNWLTFANINNNNVRDLELRVPEGSVTSLVGKAGAGKSSIAEVLDEMHESVIYVTQSLPKGNIRSTVSSYLKLTKPVAKFFADENGIRSEALVLDNLSPAACDMCGGSGLIRYERAYEASVQITCPVCEGLLFNSDVEKWKVAGIDIRTFYNTTFRALSSAVNKPRRLEKVLRLAERLGVSHLKLRRHLASLSGGERRRLKLLRKLLEKAPGKILIVDEPSAGLDNLSARTLMGLFQELKHSYLAIVVIDHKPVVFALADYLIEMGPSSGAEGGKIVFEGDPARYVEKYYGWVV